MHRWPSLWLRARAHGPGECVGGVVALGDRPRGALPTTDPQSHRQPFRTLSLHWAMVQPVPKKKQRTERRGQGGWIGTSESWRVYGCAPLSGTWFAALRSAMFGGTGRSDTPAIWDHSQGFVHDHGRLGNTGPVGHMKLLCSSFLLPARFHFVVRSNLCVAGVESASEACDSNDCFRCLKTFWPVMRPAHN